MPNNRADSACIFGLTGNGPDVSKSSGRLEQCGNITAGLRVVGPGYSSRFLVHTHFARTGTRLVSIDSGWALMRFRNGAQFPRHLFVLERSASSPAIPKETTAGRLLLFAHLPTEKFMLCPRNAVGLSETILSPRSLVLCSSQIRRNIRSVQERCRRFVPTP